MQNIFSNIPQITKTGHAAGVFSVKKMSVLSELASISSQNTVVSYFEASRSATAKKAGNTYRIGSKGALSIKSDGKWYDFAAGIGGNGLFAAYCYEHYQTPYLTDALLADAIDGAAQEFGLTQTVNRPQNDKRRAEYNRRKQQEQQQHKQAEAETATEQAKAAAIAQQIYAAAMPTTDHPYILRKQIRQVSALREISGATLQQWRVKRKNTAGVVISDKAARYLVIPVFDFQDGRDALVNVQLIHETGEKRFLQRGKKKGCYCYLAGNGALKGIAEGYATADAVRQCVSHGVFVAFDAGNLRHVADMVRERYPFAPVTIYADNDSHKHATKGKTMNPGMDAAKKAGRGACSIAFPIFAQPDGGQTTDFNDMLLREGAQAVKSSIRKSLRLNIAHPILPHDAYMLRGKPSAMQPTARVGFRDHAKKYLSECAGLQPWLESRRVSLLYAPTGSGKTDLTAKLTGRVIVLFPTNGCGRQKARQYGAHYVAAGTQPNDDRIQFGTYDSILKYSADALADVTVVVDEAHDMVHCADKHFRGDMLGVLYAQLQAAKRVILLTSTPPEMLDALFPDIESAVITSDADQPLRYVTRRANTAQAALLAMHEAGKTTVFFRNHKQAARDLRDALVAAGYTALCLDKQSVEEGDDEADNLRKHGRLSQAYDFLIITAYFAQGVDIFGVNVGAMLFDADFPLYMRKQGAARFRDADMSGVEIAILERHARRDYRATTSAAKNFAAYLRIGGEWCAMYNHAIDRGLFNAADYQTLANIKGRITNTLARQQDRFVVNALGAAYLVNLDLECAARKDIRLEQEIMAGYGMLAGGLIDTTPEEPDVAALTTAIERQREERQDAVDAWLERVAAMTPQDIEDSIEWEADRLLAACMEKLRKLAALVGAREAVRMMCEIRESDRKYSRLMRQIQNALNAENRVYSDIRQRFACGEILDEPTKQTRMRDILQKNAALRKLYSLPKSSACKLTKNRVTAILNDFCETLTHTVNGETFTAVLAYTPISRFQERDYSVTFSGQHEAHFRKKFAEFLRKNHELFPPETPANSPKAGKIHEIFLTQKTAGVTLYHAPAATDAACRDSAESEERAAIAEFGG